MQEQQASSAGWETFVAETYPDLTNTTTHVVAAPPRPSAADTGAGDFSDYELSQELMRAATDVLRFTEDALADTTTWLALADASGVVTYEWAANSDLKHLLTRADVETGVDLAEAHVGANGIGTALARRSTTLVRGTEHANEQWYALACGASPIIHPVTKTLMGIVNITCLEVEQNQHLRITLNSMVSGIQQSLLMRSRTRHQRLLDAHLRVRQVSRGPVVTLDGHTMIAEDDLGTVIDSRTLWALIESVGPLATEISLPTGQRVQIIPVARGRLSDGCSLVFERRKLNGLEVRPLVPALEAQRDRRSRLSPLEQAELDVILSVLHETEGNKSEAAAQLQISRGTLYERLRRYGLQR